MRHNKLKNFKNRLVILLAGFFLLQPSASFAGSPPASVNSSHLQDNELQSIFTMGMLSMQNGLLNEAIEIFKYLKERTDSPRVELELAWALYLNKNYLESRFIFKELLTERSIPDTIRPTLKGIVSDIDKRTSSFSWMFGVKRDSNPMNFTDEKTIQILGQEVNVVEPSENKETNGLWVNARWTKRLSDSYSAGVDGYFFDAPSNYFDYQILGADLNYFIGQSGQYSLTGRAEYKKTTINQDYSDLSLRFTKQMGLKSTSEFSIIVGENNLTDTDVFDSTYLQGSFGKIFREDKPVPLKARIGLSSVLRDDKYNSNDSLFGGLDFYSKSLPINITYSIDVKTTKHREVDPFFLKKRDDFLVSSSLSFEAPGTFLILNNYIPVITLTYITNDSKIDYFDYSKILLDVTFAEF